MGILETECERAGSAKDLILDILSDKDSCISFPGQLIETLMYNWWKISSSAGTFYQQCYYSKQPANHKSMLHGYQCSPF